MSKTTTLRITPELESAIQRYAGGRPSAWLREAALHWARLCDVAEHAPGLTGAFAKMVVAMATKEMSNDEQDKQRAG